MPRFRILLGLSLALLAGCATSGKSGGVFPCVWSDNGFALYPLYYHSSDGQGGDTYWMLGGLTGCREYRNRMTTHWLVPVYAQGEEWFASPIYTKVPTGRRGFFELYLAGLGGRTVGENGKLASHWTLPLYYRDDALFATLLYGKSPETEWVTPLYWRDAHWFANLLYASRVADASGDRQLAIPLLLTWLRWDAKGLADCWSLPCGWTGGGTTQTNAWWATPLVGTRTGRRKGGWLFPLVDFSRDPAFDEKRAAVEDEMVRAETIPASVAFPSETLTDSRGGTNARIVQRGTSGAADERTYLWLFDDDRMIEETFSEREHRYSCTSRHKVGNRLICNYETRREMTFDTKDRWKTSDSGEDGFLHLSLLWRLFRYERRPSGTDIDFLYVPIWR